MARRALMILFIPVLVSAIFAAAPSFSRVAQAEESAPATPPSNGPRPREAGAPATDPAADEFRELRNLYRESPAKAVDGFRAFLVKYPASEWDDDAQYWLAMSLDGSCAKRKDVLEAWQTLVDKYPQSPYVPDALFAAAELWQTKAERPEDYTAALKGYQAFLDRCPTNARAGEAKLRTAEIYDRLKNYDQAASWFRRMLDEDAQSPLAVRAHNELAAVYLKQDKPADALAIYERLLKAELPEQTRISARLGEVDCYLASPDGLKAALDACTSIREEARQKKTLEVFAEFKTREKMSAWYLGRKKYAEAEAEFQAYLERYGTTDWAVQAKLGIGAVRLSANKPAEAREMFHAVAATLAPGTEKPSSFVLRAALSEAFTYELEKKFDDARPLYKKLVDNWPRTTEGREAARHLERIDKADTKK